MRTYASSRVKRKSFCRKSELQMILLISGGHIGAPKRYTNMAAPFIQTSTKVRETFQQITQKVWVTKTWKIVSILLFYIISFYWLLPLDGFQFIFLLRDSENDL